MPEIEIRRMTPDDFDEVVALQRACFPEPFPADSLWQASHLANHVRQFPDGQSVAIDSQNGAVIGSVTNMRQTLGNWESHLDWESATGGLELPNHAPDGEVLYGIDISIHPDYRRQGVGRKLYEKRYELVKELGLIKYGTVCRIPDFASWAAERGRLPNAYVQEVRTGQTTDRTLTPLLALGLSYQGFIARYMEDEESGHFGVILERLR